ncbi:MAG: biotin--[acetyl-CoA-carboxylase] ligase [Syntrophomonadaceae bacterium]|jgi:BirA family biotin operon repressor/biotin-[acetyl-CoA-carboxylase] ligase
MRQKILRELVKNRDTFISGSELASYLGISRVAVWKHIEALKEEGYEIIGVSGKGYHLDNVGVILADDIKTSLKGQLIGQEIIYYPRLDSSSEALKRHLKQRKIEEGTVYVAGKQDKGKGRRGRLWESPFGGLWFSFILYPNLPMFQMALLSLTFAVALTRSLQPYLGAVCIKWPNDVYCNGKKIAGILLEVSGEVDRAEYLITGIGINLNLKHKDLPNHIASTATSLLEEGGQMIAHNDMLINVLSYLNNYYFKFLHYGFTFFRTEFKSLCLHLGKEIEVSKGQQFIKGINSDIDEMGNLIITNEHGQVSISTGDVRVIN